MSDDARSNSQGAWPALPLSEWHDTYATVHRWMQIVGKTRLARAPMQNHWWHSALYLTARGIGTSTMPDQSQGVEIEFDFVDHVLAVRMSSGASRTIPLAPRAVADFYAEYMSVLRALDIPTRIWPVPMELGDTIRFDEDRMHASYDGGAAHRCWQVLVQADRLLKVFRGGFLGKSSPSHFWWGSFDLSCTRFSGRPAPAHPGGVPNCPDFVTREAYSHECMSVGWWPGTAGGLEEPAFYAYAYPEPAGCAGAPLRPSDAFYHTALHEWILPYDAVRRSADPDAMVLAFCESTYSAAADLGRWDRASLERASETIGYGLERRKQT